MPPLALDVAIVGGGIAGLAAATALRRAGHRVTVYEQSRFVDEVGAAIHCAPNATRVLAWLGFDFEKATAVKTEWSFFADGETAEVKRSASLAHVEPTYGAPWYFFHRVDLHDGLKVLAFGDDGAGRPATLLLRKRVVSVDAQCSRVIFEDGSNATADLILGADGVHSTISKFVVDDDSSASETGQAAFRFLVPTSTLLEDEATKWLVHDRPATMNIFASADRRLVAYPCRGSKYMNFVGIHPVTYDSPEREDWKASATPEQLINVYSTFHPQYLALCKHAADLNELNLWRLIYRPPLKRWAMDNICLIGDAAHPMLPHQGQGGGMSIEDAGALGVLFSGIESKAAIPSLLQLFQSIRHSRASAVQIFSNYGQDEAHKMIAEAQRYCSGEVPASQVEFHQYLFSYDVLQDCRNHMTGTGII